MATGTEMIDKCVLNNHVEELIVLETSRVKKNACYGKYTTVSSDFWVSSTDENI